MTNRVRTEDRLIDVDERSIGISVPLPISERLDALVELVHDVGGKTTRKELMGALVLAARATGDDLLELVRHYRTATVRESLIDPDSAPARIAIEPKHPGPRRRTSRADL